VASTLSIELLDYVFGAVQVHDAHYRMKEPFTAEFPALPDGTLEITGRTDVGLIREHNEDSFLFGDLVSGKRIRENDSPRLKVEAVPSVMMVADGVGGAASGEVASSMATDIAYTYLRERWQRGGLKGTVIVADALQQALFAANKAIHARAVERQRAHARRRTGGRRSGW